MITLTRCYALPAAHILSHPSLSAEDNQRIYGKCANPAGHGHDYGLEIAVTGPVDPVTGRILDPDALDAIVRERVLSRFAYRCLNDDPAFREVQRLPVSQGYLSGAAIQFLLGEGDVLRDFHVTAIACGEASAELSLVPREPATYEKIAVKVDPTTGDISGTRLVDLLGTVVEMELSELRIDQSPSADLFRFEPPQGVRVTDLEP